MKVGLMQTKEFEEIVKAVTAQIIESKATHLTSRGDVEAIVRITLAMQVGEPDD